MQIFVDIVTATWGEAKDIRILDIDDKLIDDLSEDDLVRLATAYGRGCNGLR